MMRCNFGVAHTLCTEFLVAPLGTPHRRWGCCAPTHRPAGGPATLRAATVLDAIVARHSVCIEDGRRGVTQACARRDAPDCLRMRQLDVQTAAAIYGDEHVPPASNGIEAEAPHDTKTSDASDTIQLQCRHCTAVPHTHTQLCVPPRRRQHTVRGNTTWGSALSWLRHAITCPQPTVQAQELGLPRRCAHTVSSPL